ncbi:hypothetical protein IAT40_006949 [Kwoniella sp. CBS 6097]
MTRLATTDPPVDRSFASIPVPVQIEGDTEADLLNLKQQEDTNSQESEDFMILDDTVELDYAGEVDDIIPLDSSDDSEEISASVPNDDRHQYSVPSTNPVDRQETGILFGDDTAIGRAREEEEEEERLAEQPAPISELMNTLRTAAVILRTQNDLLKDYEEKSEKSRASLLRRVDEMGSHVSELEDLMRAEGVVIPSQDEDASSIQSMIQDQHQGLQEQIASSSTDALPRGSIVDRRAEHMLTDLTSKLDPTQTNIVDGHGRPTNAKTHRQGPSARTKDNVTLSDQDTFPAVFDLSALPDDDPSTDYVPPAGSSSNENDSFRRITRSQTGSGTPRTSQTQTQMSHLPSRSEINDVTDNGNRRHSSASTSTNSRPNCVKRTKQKIETTDEDENLYVIESIIGTKEIPSSIPGKKEHLYLAKWRDYPVIDSSWEPKVHIPDIDDLYFEFYQAALEEGSDPRRKVVLLEEAREAWDEEGNKKVT